MLIETLWREGLVPGRRPPEPFWAHQTATESQAAAALAEQLAADFGLDASTVELAKAAALERFELEG